ncbi:type IV pili methyl-accepting chemotaxis transducer N-terminal domain-containing protein [Paucibacter sp. DJ2R-2]|uniref:type IV pili methyl-accepting chemotaxis transducer N-terminal domain-containing protein n=1 Tax=Paucibacter sp. DJ2R-2 TaxID=2893558 RepID=UPI0021E39330|nr:type IV pili methyl-accepting chemotaxis transducer N-terminal domain-containing protein [Paucibacter sp. DJ2R-2]MCV2422193.1 type IV pili methyl-accepting chemotaxis transducer N-terminal domain-containing protein [Paucibacter sp. DJ4R-1]MCV2440223.1 type IV pili methyl-accepting chemotaxis transducer N-terminal domain-containing protein [Paucibacter sp. DJ2R-2]
MNLSSPRLPWSLGAKLNLIGACLLLLALSGIGLMMSFTRQLDGGAAAVNEAGRMRMQTWRLAQSLEGGNSALIGGQLAQFEQSLLLLRRGDPTRPLVLPKDPATRAAFVVVQDEWLRLRSDWTSGPAPQAEQVAERATQFVAHIDDFVSAIESQLASLTALLNWLQFAMVGLALTAAAALLHAGYRLILRPLNRLQTGLAQVGRGDLEARVSVSSHDEFGALSEGFNAMAATLQGLYQNLEAQVSAKTQDLALQNTRLAALYRAADWVSKADSLPMLAQGFATQLRAVAQADASAVRWSDEGNRRYLLLASDGLPQALVDEEQCVPTGTCFCGQTLDSAETRVIPILPLQDGPDAGERAMLGHCERAGFQAVITVPVRLHERMLGELNLFYRQPKELAADERALLETLASHLAGAIEGLRASAMEREAAVAEERGLLARELHDSIAQSLSFLKIQVSLLRQAQERQQPEAAAQAVAELDAGVRESLADVRALLLHFRTRTNGEDILPALQSTLRKFEQQSGLQSELSMANDGLPLAADVQVQVLHVVQEALSNVRKHAQARRVWVSVQQRPFWRVEVRDDGCGFQPDAAAWDETHVGLRIMQERAARIGGRVEVSSVPGQGSRVVLSLEPMVAADAGIQKGNA